MIDILHTFADVVLEGIDGLLDYFLGEEREIGFFFGRVLSLTIAFALSGAIVALLTKEAILRFFGPKTDKRLSFLVASVSGAVLAVCSCSVLPMFASIRKKGAGIGPATAFLFSGPAVNVLAIILTFSFFGLAVGLVRVVGAIALALVIGLAMFFIWHRRETIDANEQLFAAGGRAETSRASWQTGLFFLTLIGMLVGQYVTLAVTGVLGALLILELALFFDRQEMLAWGRATLDLARRIIPLFVIGIFIAGIIGYFLTEEILVPLVGANTYPQNLLASAFGAFMYFATLTEVPIVRAFLDSGMHLGPATALLLAGPSLSLPNMIVIGKVLGFRRSATYFLLVILFSGVVGLIGGLWFYG